MASPALPQPEDVHLNNAPSSSATAAPSPPAAAPQPPVKHLVLDAGPLLSLAPLRGMAATYHTTPGVLAELRDPRAREHWERLSQGVEGGVRVREPDAISVAKVSAFAKGTGDYSVLSKVDLSVLALTFMLEVEENGYARVRDEYGKPPKGTKPLRKARAEARKPAATDAAPSATEAPQPTPSSEAGPSAPRAPPKNPWNIPAPATLGGGPGAGAPEDDDEGDEDEVDEYDEDEYPALGHGVWGAHGEVDDADEDEQEGGEGSQALEPVEERRTWSGPSKAGKTAGSPAVDKTADDLARTTLGEPSAPLDRHSALPATPAEPLYAEEEPSSRADADDSDDGEWITPTNVAHHKSLDLGLVPAADGDASAAAADGAGGKKKKRKGKAKGPAVVPQMKAACMTGDYAVQNVLLQMGLNLVGEQGKRIGMVKSWVLRCHACFKICKDQSKKFCPSCGNPTLIRASVSTKAADGSTDPAASDAVQVHLKPNFQYRMRGTVYSIPQPKMGAAKGQNAGGSGLILREDQKEFMSAVRREEGRRAKEERALARAVKNEAEGKGHLGGWNDPDWLPEMLVVGLSGKGRRGDEQLPDIGYGRRNPNQVRRKKK